MTAREMAVEKAISFKGKRNEVVDVYNTYRPFPRNYRVKYDDMLCATYVSAIFIALGWTDIVPPECGAWRLYANMEALGRAVLDKTRVPEPGDLIFFGNGKVKTAITHVGIVESITNNGKRIYYWDVQNTAGRHTCPVGYSWIMGYGMPDYTSKDQYEIPLPDPAPSNESPVFKAGDLVRVKKGAKWYRGSTIKASVFDDMWYIVQVKGDRAVLGMNYAESRDIQSPINVKDIEHVLPQIETPVEEIKTVKLTAVILEETSDRLFAMASQTGKDVGEIIDSIVKELK